jgi:hypothetical protein
MAMRAEEMAVMAPPPRVRDSIAWLVGFASARADTRYPAEEVRQWLEAAPKDGVDVFTALDAAIARAEAAERERDEWRAVAESRPAITAEDCAAGPWAVVGGWDLASNNAAARIEDALEAHGAKVKP